MTKAKRHPQDYMKVLVATLSISVSMGAFAMDIYIPFIPFLTQEFDASPELIQYTLSIFMIFMALSQLFIGPISDQYGRKRVLLLSCFNFFLGSIICALTKNIYFFLFGRSMQAIGACGGYAVSIACVRDSFSGRESQKAFSYFVGINGIAPIIAPILGTIIAHVSGSWRFCFHYLALTGIISFYLINNYLYETKIDQTRASNWPTMKDVGKVFFHRVYQRWFLVPITIMTGLFTFFSISTHYIQTTLGFSTLSYSIFFGINGLVYTMGSLSSSFIANKITPEKMVLYSLFIIALCSTVLCLHPLIPNSPPIIFFICSYTMASIYGLIFGVVTGLLLEPFSQRAGLAAALNGALQFLVAPIMTNIFVAPPILNGLPYGLPLLILSTASIVKSLKNI